MASAGEDQRALHPHPHSLPPRAHPLPPTRAAAAMLLSDLVDGAAPEPLSLGVRAGMSRFGGDSDDDDDEEGEDDEVSRDAGEDPLMEDDVEVRADSGPARGPRQREAPCRRPPCIRRARYGHS